LDKGETLRRERKGVIYLESRENDLGKGSGGGGLSCRRNSKFEKRTGSELPHVKSSRGKEGREGFGEKLGDESSVWGKLTNKGHMGRVSLRVKGGEEEKIPTGV